MPRPCSLATGWRSGQATKPRDDTRQMRSGRGDRPEAVTVHTTLMGGGFGRRAETDYSVQATRIAAVLPGTPIRMTWTREEDMRHDFIALRPWHGFAVWWRMARRN